MPPAVPAGEAAPPTKAALNSGKSDVGKQRAIDAGLRDRLVNDIAAFIVALDTAGESDSVEARRALLDATDRLLRAGARARLELVRTTPLR
jgi:hypothetical protein